MLLLTIIARRAVLRPFISFLLIALLCGCANDQQRTVTGGTAIGTLAGAIIGGGLGALAGALSGNSDNASRYALGGAAIGAAAGGAIGYGWGKAKARRKAEYARTEDYLNACISDARALRQKAETENVRLNKQIAQLRQESQNLAVSYRKNQATRAQLLAEGSNINRRRADLQQKIQRVSDELVLQQQVLSQESQIGDTSPRLNELRAEIRGLSMQKTELEARNRELASISNRMSI
jgi:hypothetical protein